MSLGSSRATLARIQGWLYSPNGSDERNPTLYGAVRTSEDGSHAFDTIRPGSYPGQGIPEHIHYRVEAANGEVLRFELHFADDPKLDTETVDLPNQVARLARVATVSSRDAAISNWRTPLPDRVGGRPDSPTRRPPSNLPQPASLSPFRPAWCTLRFAVDSSPDSLRSGGTEP